MENLSGSLGTSDVQFSLMTMNCYFLINFGKDEFMSSNYYCLITIAGEQPRSQINVTDTVHRIHLIPLRHKKDALCMAFRPFSCCTV